MTAYKDAAGNKAVVEAARATLDSYLGSEDECATIRCETLAALIQEHDAVVSLCNRYIGALSEVTAELNRTTPSLALNPDHSSAMAYANAVGNALMERDRLRAVAGQMAAALRLVATHHHDADVLAVVDAALAAFEGGYRPCPVAPGQDWGDQY